MVEAITETNFELPGQVGDVYRGKVGDVYTLEHAGEELLAVVRTDRISAFDVVLPRPIPYKGQVLNQMSAALLEATADVAPNWLLASPDPNVSVGHKAEPIRVEMIMRANLVGSAWAGYQEGNRDLCGNPLPDGMREFEPFDIPLITPTTKATTGHDENIVPYEIVQNGLATYREYDEMASMAVNLFESGQRMAVERGLVLVDTKYEFGKLATGQIVVIDEAHTPDSSRYFDAQELDDYLSGARTERPRQQSKEFVREWLKAHGFTGAEGQIPPDMPDDFIEEVTERYISLFEEMLGEPFRQPSNGNPIERIQQNITSYLESV